MRALIPMLRRLPAVSRRRATLVLLLFCLLVAAAGTVRAAGTVPPADAPPPGAPPSDAPPADAAPADAGTGPAAGSGATSGALPDADATAGRPALDRSLLLSVIRSALGVLRPRTLEPHDAAELCGWGLNGLAAIDPALSVSAVGTRLTLAEAQTPILSIDEPAAGNVEGWARLVVTVAAAAWNSSATLRESGQQALIQSFFDELFNHLDPYSRYVAPAPAETDRTARSGGQAGAGLSLMRQNRALLVSAVSANGPAWSAGIAVGSRLLAVDGTPVRSMTAEAAAALLAGDPGTAVTVSVLPPGRRRPVRYALTRAAVPPETVFAFTNGDTVVLRITAFSADTALEMSQFLSEATGADGGGADDADAGPDDGADAATPPRHRLHGLIIDLRGNRGGLLQQAVTSVALVLDHGVAVTTRGRDPQSNHVWAVQGGDLTDGAPIVVLVDGRTASAAEIMAAALSDQHRAVVVGSATLGKGLVQFLAQMPDGGELFVTWSRVLAPLGWPLQGLGVMPQLCTSLGGARLDAQLRDLSQGRWDMRDAVADSRAARAPLPAARILELRAPCPAAVGSDDDIDAARALLDSPGAYDAALVPAG